MAEKEPEFKIGPENSTGLDAAFDDLDATVNSLQKKHGLNPIAQETGASKKLFSFGHPDGDKQPTDHSEPDLIKKRVPDIAEAEVGDNTRIDATQDAKDAPTNAPDNRSDAQKKYDAAKLKYEAAKEKAFDGKTRGFLKTAAMYATNIALAPVTIPIGIATVGMAAGIGIIDATVGKGLGFVSGIASGCAAIGDFCSRAVEKIGEMGVAAGAGLQMIGAKMEIDGGLKGAIGAAIGAVGFAGEKVASAAEVTGGAGQKVAQYLKDDVKETQVRRENRSNVVEKTLDVGFELLIGRATQAAELNQKHKDDAAAKATALTPEAREAASRLVTAGVIKPANDNTIQAPRSTPIGQQQGQNQQMVAARS